MEQITVSLPYRFIQIVGKDAEKFLQGQCSIDLATSNMKNFYYGTLNTPKGRMYALFKLIRTEQGLLLSLHESTFENALATLKKYAVFFKCELSEASFFSYGTNELKNESIGNILNIAQATEELADSNNKTVIEGVHILSLPGKNKLFELWTSNQLTLPSNKAENLENWLATEASNGIPQLFESTIEQFILQELNLHELGAVSFKKGCYTGQEIIARMKYLGKLKKRMFLLKSEVPNRSLEPGSTVFVQAKTGDDRKKAGKLVRSHSSSTGKTVALAVLNQELINEHSVATIDEQPEVEFCITTLSYSD